MKLPSRPRRAPAFICRYMLIRFQNHQAPPDLAPGISSSWNAQNGAQHVESAGFRLYRMTFGQASSLVSALSRLLMVALQSVSDHVKAGIGAELAVHLVVDIAASSCECICADNVVLLVQGTQLRQRVGGVLVALLLGRGLTGTGLLEGNSRLFAFVSARDVVRPWSEARQPLDEEELRASSSALTARNLRGQTCGPQLQRP